MPVIKSGFEALGADHICFATDYPYELEKIAHVKNVIAAINRLGESDENKRKFFSGNVRKAFKI